MLTLNLQQERQRLLDEMGQIDQMIRGHLSEQTYQVRRHGQTITQGPYYLLQRRENGRTKGQRVAAEERVRIVAGVEGHRRFQKLAARYVALTEQMTWTQQPPDVKKKFRRFWPSISRKPPLS